MKSFQSECTKVALDSRYAVITNLPFSRIISSPKKEILFLFICSYNFVHRAAITKFLKTLL